MKKYASKPPSPNLSTEQQEAGKLFEILHLAYSLNHTVYLGGGWMEGWGGIFRVSFYISI